MKARIKQILYLIGGIICFVFSIALFYVLWKAVRFGVFAVFSIGIILLGFPFLMRHGLKKLYKERTTIEVLLSRNMPVNLNKSRVFGLFCEVLLLFWLLVPATFLIPAGILTAVVLIPATVVMFVVEAKVSDIWEDIGWRKGTYWLMNFAFYILGLILGYSLNLLLY